MEKELISKEHKAFRLEDERKIRIDQLTLVNKKLDKPLDSQELLEIVRELYCHLSKYSDVICTIRERGRPSSSLDLTKSNYQN